MTHLVVLLDRSTSMLPTVDLTLRTFNEAQDQYQKTLPPYSHYTLATFSSHQTPLLEYIFDHHPLTSLTPLQRHQFQPQGLTALYDALYELLTHLPNEKTIVLILTDGQENDSRQHTRDEIFQKINQLRDEKQWEFVFLGANQDSYIAGSQLGIHYNIDFQQDESMPVLMRNVSRAISDLSQGNHQTLTRISSTHSEINVSNPCELPVLSPPLLRRSYQTTESLSSCSKSSDLS
jgi:hypothetical protein